MNDPCVVVIWEEVVQLCLFRAMRPRPFLLGILLHFCMLHKKSVQNASLGMNVLASTNAA